MISKRPIVFLSILRLSVNRAIYRCIFVFIIIRLPFASMHYLYYKLMDCMYINLILGFVFRASKLLFRSSAVNHVTAVP